MRRIFRTASMFIMLLVLLGGASAALRETADAKQEFPTYPIEKVRFKKGESVWYEFGWNGIPAASAVVTVNTEEIDGKMYYLFAGTARTNSFIDLFWKLRDKSESYVSVDDFKPFKYNYDRHENSVLRQIRVVFDNQAKVADSIFSKKGAEKDIKERKRALRYTNAMDPVSICYYMRCINLDGEENKKVEIIDGKSRYVVELEILGKERITVGAGTFDAIKCMPHITKYRKDGTERGTKMKTATIWVSDDENRIPLKIKSDVFVGHVYGELKKYKLE